VIPQQPKVLLALCEQERSKAVAEEAGCADAVAHHAECIERLKKEARELARGGAQR